MEQITELTTKQKMLAFAFLADITARVVFDVAEAKDLESVQQGFEKELQTALNNIITNSDMTAYFGDGWTCCNYPWVDIEVDPRNIYLARNTTAIFTNGNEIVIAVAGTNFVENYDWFTEDLGVVDQQSWTEVLISLSGSAVGDTVLSERMVAQGTVTALTNTWLQKGAVSGNKLVDDLKAVVSGLTDIRLTVTGHSLGGAISPVLAQALWELREQWTPASATVSVSAYPFAGPTVGNQEFVDYVQPKEMLEGTIQLVSTYNTIDVVPHGWNLGMMNQMHDLFSPVVHDADTAEYGALIKATLQWLIGKSTHTIQSDNYVRWNTEETFTGSVPSTLEQIALFDGEAITFATYLKHQLETDSANADTLEAMKKICGIQDLSKKAEAGKFHNYLVYLGKYLLMLGRQHINEYAVTIYNNPTFHNKIKGLIKAEKSNWNTKQDKTAGMAVLEQLFIDVAGMNL